MIGSTGPFRKDLFVLQHVLVDAWVLPLQDVDTSTCPAGVYRMHTVALLVIVL